jgi:hypothetical protein
MDRSRPGRRLARQYATRVFHTHTLHGFFNLSTWLTAIAGAAVLLLIFHLISARSTGSSRSRRFAHR